MIWMSSDGFSSPPIADHTSAIERSSDGGSATRRITGTGAFFSDAAQQVGRQRLGGEEGAEQRRQQPVLVLGPLRPGGDQVRQPEPPRRRPALHHAAGLIADVAPDDLPPVEVLADVVQVEVDRGRVPARDPFLGRRVEQHLDARPVEGVAPDERFERLVDVLDHRPKTGSWRWTARQPVGGIRSGPRRRPIGQTWPPQRRSARSLRRPGSAASLRSTHSAQRGEAQCRQYLSPGVYVEEVEAGSRPIEGVGTAVAAFVGLAARGPTNTPTLVTNWSQFVSAFGDFMEGAYLAHAVYGYFLNGGGAAYVVRIGGDGARRHAHGPSCPAPEGQPS